jgi:hypothetical protein
MTSDLKIRSEAAMRLGVNGCDLFFQVFILVCPVCLAFLAQSAIRALFGTG